MISIPIEISARHIHLSQPDLDALFGANYTLTPVKNLSQPGQFAAEEVVEIQTRGTWGVPPHFDFTFGKSCDHNQVRILGPVRAQTQIELSWSDFIIAGLVPHVAVSGDTNNSPGGLIVIGPQGEIKVETGIIIAHRHIHCRPDKATEFNLKDRQIVAVRVYRDETNAAELPARQLTFHNVIIRVSDKFDWQMHIDTDEANAAGIANMGIGEILI